MLRNTIKKGKKNNINDKSNDILYKSMYKMSTNV